MTSVWWLSLIHISFVWRKTVERNRERLMKKIHVLLGQIDDVIAQEKYSESNEEAVSYTHPALNVEGIKNKKGNKWYFATIRDMLINPVYMGKARYALKKAPAKEEMCIRDRL